MNTKPDLSFSWAKLSPIWIWYWTHKYDAFQMQLRCGALLDRSDQILVLKYDHIYSILFERAAQLFVGYACLTYKMKYSYVLMKKLKTFEDVFASAHTLFNPFQPFQLFQIPCNHLANKGEFGKNRAWMPKLVVSFFTNSGDIIASRSSLQASKLRKYWNSSIS